MQLTSIPYSPAFSIWSESDFAGHWGKWLIYILYNQKIKITLENSLLLAITSYDAMSFFDYAATYHDALLNSPIVVLVVTVLLENTEIWDVWMACYFCELDNSLYFRMKVLTGNLNKTITELFTPKIYSHHRVNVSFGIAGLTRPIFSVEINSGRGHLRNGIRIQCFGFGSSVSVSLLLRSYKRPLNLTSFIDECLHQNVLTFEIVGEKLNHTIYFRGSVDNSWNTSYSGTIAKVFPVSTTTLRQKFYTDTLEYILLDTVGTKPTYCENQTVFQKHMNKVTIIGLSFGVTTWVLKFAFIFAIVVYLSKTSKNNLANILFDVFRMVLQRNLRKVDFVKILSLIICFFLEFFYLTVLPGNIIASPAPYVKQTVTELLRDGYKFFAGVLTINIQEHVFIHDNIFMQLVNRTVTTTEGYNDDILNPEKYWWSALNVDDFEDTRALQKEEDWRMKHLKMIMFTTAESLKQNRFESAWVSKEKCKRLNIMSWNANNVCTSSGDCMDSFESEKKSTKCFASCCP